MNGRNTAKPFHWDQTIFEKNRFGFRQMGTFGTLIVLKVFILTESIPLLISPAAELKPVNPFISGGNTVLIGSHPISREAITPFLPQVVIPDNRPSPSVSPVTGSAQTVQKCENCTNTNRYTSWDKMPRISQDEEKRKIAALKKISPVKEGAGCLVIPRSQT